MAQRLVELVGVTPEDAAVEIGPGTGQLTRPLVAVARRTVAIEVDRGLVELLGELDWPGELELRHEDVLQADLGGIVRELGPPVVLLGNLPYSISGRILVALLSPNNPFRRWGLMLQREVADRVLAGPGTPEYGTLSVWARLFSRAERALDLSATEFSPRRKTLRRALKGMVEGVEAALEEVGVDPMRRGETLDEIEFLALANALAARQQPR
jgi:16S rRNA (adenine1518-N6/adenine1519-N6)-dimethyltransferase